MVSDWKSRVTWGPFFSTAKFWHCQAWGFLVSLWNSSVSVVIYENCLDLKSFRVRAELHASLSIHETCLLLRKIRATVCFSNFQHLSSDDGFFLHSHELCTDWKECSWPGSEGGRNTYGIEKITMELPFAWLRLVLRDPNSEEVMVLIHWMRENLRFIFGWKSVLIVLGSLSTLKGRIWVT